MKHTQLLRAWSLRSVTSNDGRRLITLWRGAESHQTRQSVAKTLAPAKPKAANKVSVAFGSEPETAFIPAVHSAPVAGQKPIAAKSQHPKTH